MKEDRESGTCKMSSISVDEPKLRLPKLTARATRHAQLLPRFEWIYSNTLFIPVHACPRSWSRFIKSFFPVPSSLSITSILAFSSLVKKLITMGNRRSSTNNQDAEATSRYPQASDHHHSESRLSVGLAEFFSRKYDDDTMDRTSTGFVTTAAESLSPALVATPQLSQDLITQYIKHFPATYW